MSLMLAVRGHTGVVATAENRISSHSNAQINMLRSVAICSVVWGHCLLGLEHKIFVGFDDQIVQLNGVGFSPIVRCFADASNSPWPGWRHVAFRL